MSVALSSWRLGSFCAACIQEQCHPFSRTVSLKMVRFRARSHWRDVDVLTSSLNVSSVPGTVAWKVLILVHFPSFAAV